MGQIGIASVKTKKKTKTSNLTPINKKKRLAAASGRGPLRERWAGFLLCNNA